MASPSNPSSSTQTLSVGNVVSAGFRLYGANSKQYLTIALFGTLWILLPFVAVIAVVIFFAVVQNYYTTLGLIIPALIVLFLYAIAKYLSNSALISRLAFGELTNQPEALSEARRYVKAREWSFLGTAFLLGLIYTGVLIVFYLVLTIAVVGLLATTGFQLFQNPTPPDAGTLVLMGLFALVQVLLVCLFFFWFGARFVAAEVPLAVEPGATATQTIGRMWSLTKGSAWRIALILFVTFLVTLPIQLLVQIVSGAGDVIVRAVGIAADAPSYAALSGLIAFVLSMALSVVVLPLWQIIKAVIYYDLRSRREGLGLRLRDHDSKL